MDKKVWIKLNKPWTLTKRIRTKKTNKKNIMGVKWFKNIKWIKN